MPQLQTVSIDQLKPGMMVEAVVTKNRNLAVKREQKICSPNVIEWLKRKGVKQLVVHLEEKQLERNHCNEGNPGFSLGNAINDATAYRNYSGFSWDDAYDIYNSGKDIIKRAFKAAQLGSSLNMTALSNLAESIMHGLEKRPLPLLCMPMLRSSEDYNFEHAINCGILMAYFSMSQGFEPRLVKQMVLAGFLHDIGMAVVPRSIATSKQPLKPDDTAIVNKHIFNALDFLKNIRGLDEAILAIGFHHERIDGKGYPNGSPAQEINVFGRMLAIVDSYDALLADRPHRNAVTPADAMKLILKCANKHYDRELVCKFIKCFGVYPLGSLVQLHSGHLAMVVALTELPFKPALHMFDNLDCGQKKTNRGAYRSEIAQDIRRPAEIKNYREHYAKLLGAVL